MKKENILKRTIMLILVLTLVMNVLTGCSEATKVEKETKVHQTECGSEDVELETECEEHEWESEVENETEPEDIDSVQLETEVETEVKTEVENETENSTENSTVNKTETETNKQTSKKNNTGKNNSTQSGSSNNNSSQGKKEQVGLSKDNYVYVAGGTSSQNSKEVELGKEIIKKIIKSGMSDFDKVKAINDYMMKNVSYDMENYKKNTIPAASYTALGAMEKKVAVCAGYAKMFRVLATCAGLEVTYITGDTPYGYHAWNQVKVDGKWYNIDVTWNDPDCETNESGHYYCGCYQYFLLSNEDFNKKHTPSVKVNETGSSRDFEVYKQGCPYDGATEYYKTQEDFDKLVKEMVAAGKTTIRIMSDKQKVEDKVLNALKKQGIYGGCKVTTKDNIRVYRETNEVIYRLTLDISLDGGTYAEAKKLKIASVAEAKKVLENSFKNYEALKNGDVAVVKLYVGADYINNTNFEAELNNWAQYEKKMSISINYFDKQVDIGVYELCVYFDPKPSGANYVHEIITNTKDIELAIKRMFQYGYAKISMSVQASDYKLAGDHNEARNTFINKFCKPLSEKYCLEFDYSRVDVENNIIVISFGANGHNVEYRDWEIEKKATCVSEGLEVKICRICNKAGEQRVVPKNDNHSYYWDQKGNSRTQKCKSCSYVGITEVCYGGVWGYFDEEAAQKELHSINNQRANIWKCKTDDWGNVIEVFSPPALVVNEELIKLAKERLAVLNSTDFESHISNEYAIRYTPYSNTYKKKQASYSDRYHEKYSEVGIICFKYDVNNDGSKFADIYVEEFGLARDFLFGNIFL